MTTSLDYRRGRSCVFALHAHLVFVTKYRRGVFTDIHHQAMRPIFEKVCDDFGASLIACDGEDDHVHLLVEYPPTVELSKLVNSLKGVSSRLLRKSFRLRTHREHLWSPSYFAASCGGAPLSIIREYVESQRTRGSLTRP
ncbi:MAG: IS200/IS605 family transposase [Actinomycetota bacterium]|nr:IS200/IS605 family transposase [Actinomycetota bacterium]